MASDGQASAALDTLQTLAAATEMADAGGQMSASC